MGGLLPVADVARKGFLSARTILSVSPSDNIKGHPYLLIKIANLAFFSSGTLFLNIRRAGSLDTLIITLNTDGSGSELLSCDVAVLGGNTVPNISSVKYMLLDNSEVWLEVKIKTYSYINNAYAFSLAQQIYDMKYSDTPIEGATTTIEGNIRKL
ncbi:hypothetical protein [uncultured Bacteroides sp.]|uniref:hypothetical protein n=1 Tax=uncultured Bacteroides sp. TaxID=162156 RepID=UPI00260ECFBB|nr:hypothetical protein [uncultured Bacteroides sp.]